MPRPASRFSYPVFLDLADVDVLVVGGGPIGARKAAGLAASGAIIRLVAIEISDAVDRAGIVARGGDIRQRAFDERDLDDIRLVITATGDAATDAAVAAAARRRGIWVNAADQPADCDFILPAITRSGRVTAAVSTDGASPALAGHLRDRVAEIITPEVAQIADTLAAERRAVRARGGSTEDIDWRPRIAELFERRSC